jgi:hypothetical protein
MPLLRHPLARFLGTAPHQHPEHIFPYAIHHVMQKAG